MKLKNKYKILLICFIMLCLPIISLASEEMFKPEYTEEYKRWLELSEEERKNHIQPPIYEMNRGENDSKKDRLGENLPSKYVMNYYGPVKDQGSTSACWAYSATTVFDSNYYNTNSTKKTFSDIHMDYKTAIEYNERGFSREVDEGGNMFIALAYATNGMGLALESNMPETITKQSLANVESDSKVSEYVILSNINDIKSHIYNYGAVSSATYMSTSFLSTTNPFGEKDVAYLCTNPYVGTNHAITLVGWDDNYTNAAFPGHKGAYMVLNSYGAEFGNNGIYYILYDDVYVNNYAMFGVKKTDEIDYDNIYQYDEHGCIGAYGYTGGTYAANVFTRKNTGVQEKLTEVGLFVPDSGYVTIYINPNSDDVRVKNATVQKSVYISRPGYYTIELDKEININGDKFVIGAKYPQGFGAQERIAGSYVTNATSEWGESFASPDGVTYFDLKDTDLNNANVCIKAFTEEQFMIPQVNVQLPKYVFDSKYYAEKNQDIVAILGDNENTLKWHFLNAGIREGRKSSPTFCVAEYLEYNRDLLNVFGHDYMAFYNHFINYGCHEGRRGSSEFDPFFYRYFYNDLTGFDNIRLLDQYVTRGIYEGRIGALETYTDMIVYDPEVYLFFNADLCTIFGTDQQKFKQHWLQFGLSEGRRASILYDSNAYKEYNRDLFNAIGSSNKSFFEHFVKYGLNERRTSTYVFKYSKYIEKNPGLEEYYKGDYKQVYLHFKNFGLEEGRIASDRFYVSTYMNSSRDLIPLYGTNKKYYCIHYIAYGKDEPRKAI